MRKNYFDTWRKPLKQQMPKPTTSGGMKPLHRIACGPDAPALSWHPLAPTLPRRHLHTARALTNKEHDAEDDLNARPNADAHAAGSRSRREQQAADAAHAG